MWNTWYTWQLCVYPTSARVYQGSIVDLKGADESTLAKQSLFLYGVYGVYAVKITCITWGARGLCGHLKALESGCR